jgi:nitrous oxidase accessory protein NosD
MDNSSNKVLNVDKDFGGDLDKAIAAANDGDTVELGKKTYKTSGMSLNKDITIDGVRGQSVIDGEGSSNSIITINEAASGTTIKDLEITDGNNGVNVTGAENVTLKNLDINNIGLENPVRNEGTNSIGVSLANADGFKVLNSKISDIGRKGIGVIDTDTGTIDGNTLSNINLDAEHSQSVDAGGIKLFNTDDINITNNKLSGVNAFNIWDDITRDTTIDGNEITGVGEDFLAPEYNSFVRVAGIYVEKTYQTTVDNNKVTVGNDDFYAFDATEFSTETMVLGENNEFPSTDIGSTDFWADGIGDLEKKVAMTEDPDAANFSLFADDFYNGGTYGGDNTGDTV